MHSIIVCGCRFGSYCTPCSIQFRFCSMLVLIKFTFVMYFTFACDLSYGMLLQLCKISRNTEHGLLALLVVLSLFIDPDIFPFCSRFFFRELCPNLHRWAFPVHASRGQVPHSTEARHVMETPAIHRAGQVLTSPTSLERRQRDNSYLR